MIPYGTNPKRDDVFQFGSYGPTGARKLPISWKVLDVRENRMLVLAERVLDMQPFHDAAEITRWESCTLRQWLNSHFWETAFSAAEQELIDEPVQREDPLGAFLWQMHGLENTTDTIGDRIFLLNLTDIHTYYPSENNMFHQGISAKAAENLTDVSNDELCWWLRTSSNQIPMAHIVSPVDSVGLSVIEPQNPQGVRPAIWLRITN